MNTARLVELPVAGEGAHALSVEACVRVVFILRGGAAAYSPHRSSSVVPFGERVSLGRALSYSGIGERLRMLGFLALPDMSYGLLHVGYACMHDTMFLLAQMHSLVAHPSGDARVEFTYLKTSTQPLLTSRPQ